MTPWTIAHQAPLSIGFSRQEYWSGLPCPSPRDLPDPGIEPESPALQSDYLPSEPPGKPLVHQNGEPFYYFQMMLVVKNLPTFLRNVREEGLTPGSGRSPGGGHSNPLQFSCLENPMDRGAGWATVQRVAKSWTQIK